MVSVPCLIYYFSVFSLLPIISSIDIPLSHFPTEQYPFKDPYRTLNLLVSTSLTRAHRLKNPKPRPTPSTTTAPLSSHTYGAYSIPLSFGTPPQTLSFIMDTGSNFVWFPCTTHYVCNNCSYLLPSPTSKIPSFIPKQSSSSKIIGCKNPKCSWIHPAINSCPQQICPPYLILYGSGTTGGVALSETLRLNDLVVPNFLVGCSVFSSRQPAGIAGFGRGTSSLPSQLNLAKFSYCSLSYESINNQTIQNYVLLDYAQTGSDKKTETMIYTPLVKNPEVEDKPSFSVYYYVGLRRISLGGRRVKVPYKYLSPGDQDGNGGTILDSGTTFTFLSRGAFEPLSGELVAQMEGRGYRRDVEAENLSGLKPCFDVSGVDRVIFPELRLHFKGGAEMVLPAENYLVFVGGDRRMVCLTVVTDEADGSDDEEVGPGIILGNFQMQNFYVEFDLENERVGFKQQDC